MFYDYISLYAPTIVILQTTGIYDLKYAYIKKMILFFELDPVLFQHFKFYVSTIIFTSVVRSYWKGLRAKYILMDLAFNIRSIRNE